MRSNVIPCACMTATGSAGPGLLEPATVATVLTVFNAFNEQQWLFFALLLAVLGQPGYGSF